MRLYEKIKRIFGIDRSAPVPSDSSGTVGVAEASSLTRSLVGIVYVDSHDATSQRIIEVGQIRQVEPSLNEYIAYCHQRKALRQFRSDRVRSFFEPSTGEILQDVRLVADPSVLSHTYVAVEKMPLSPPNEVRVQHVYDRYSDELRGLG
jgi:predicted DNA-binding transcriptional regulator YafY